MASAARAKASAAARMKAAPVRLTFAEEAMIAAASYDESGRRGSGRWWEGGVTRLELGVGDGVASAHSLAAVNPARVKVPTCPFMFVFCACSTAVISIPIGLYLFYQYT